MTQPTGVVADGSLKVLFVPTIAITSAPTVAELTAGSVVDLSCYLTADGYSPSTDEGAVVDSRLCSRQDFERAGRFKEGLEIGYVYQGQELAASDNKAHSTLTHLTAGYIVTRWGADYETAIAAADIVDVYPIQCGRQRKQPPEQNASLKIRQKMFITGSMQTDVAVAA